MIVDISLYACDGHEPHQYRQCSHIVRSTFECCIFIYMEISPFATRFHYLYVSMCILHSAYSANIVTPIVYAERKTKIKKEQSDTTEIKIGRVEINNNERPDHAVYFSQSVHNVYYM